MVSGYFEYVITTTTLAIVVAGWFFSSDRAQKFLAPSKLLKWLLSACAFATYLTETFVTWRVWSKSNELIGLIKKIEGLGIPPPSYEGAALSSQLALMILTAHFAMFTLLTAAVWKKN